MLPSTNQITYNTCKNHDNTQMTDNLIIFSQKLAENNYNKRNLRKKPQKHRLNLHKTIRTLTRDEFSQKKSSRLKNNNVQTQVRSITQVAIESEKHSRKDFKSMAKTLQLDKREKIKNPETQTEIRFISQRNILGESDFPGTNTTQQLIKIKYKGKKLQSSFQNTQKQDQQQKYANRITNFMNNFQKIQKNNNKGPLQLKHLEKWLNDTLLDYCINEKFEGGGQNSALKKYSIDRNGLFSLGLKQQDLVRLYRSLFVYSIGFNNLIRQLTGYPSHDNRGLRKTIWKVYSILLQYCGKGQFESMIAQIQRDKTMKINDLKNQIEKRQILIEDNDERNETKNQSVYKEIKQLREQNYELNKQKLIMIANLKESELSFNHEVELRLKFQNKINQIYGIHRQACDKHAKLYSDFKKKNQQIAEIKNQLKSALQQNQILKNQKMGIILENKNYQTQVFNFSKQIETLKFTINSNKAIIAELISKKQALSQKNLDYKTQIDAIKVKIQKLSEQLTRSVKLANDTNNDLQMSLNQNGKLHAQIAQNSRKISFFLKQQNTVNQRINSVMADLTYYKGVCKQLEGQLGIEKLKIKQYQEKNRINEVQLEVQRKNTENIQKQNKQILSTIKEMKIINNKLQSELQKVTKQYLQISQINSSTQSKVTIFGNKKLQSQYSRTNMKIKIINLQAQVSHLKNLVKQHQRLKFQSQTEKRKLLINYQQQKSKSQMFLESSRLELQKLSTLYENTNDTMKNEKFERQNLIAKYQQCLLVLQNQNEHVKELNRYISQLKEQVEVNKLKLKSSENQHQKINLQLKIKIKQLNQQLQKANIEIFNKSYYLHPMIYQDIFVKLIQKEQKIKKITTQKNQLFAKLQKDTKNNVQTILKIQQTSKNEISDLNLSILKLKETFNNQLEYQIDKNKNLTQKLSDLQILLIQFKDKSDKVRIQQQSFEKEKQYQKIILQKSTHIKALLSDLQEAHDSNSKLKSDLSFIQQALQQKQNKISELVTSIDKSLKDINDLEKQVQRLNTQRTELLADVKYKIKLSPTKMQNEGEKQIERIIQKSRMISRQSKMKEDQSQQRQYDSVLTNKYIEMDRRRFESSERADFTKKLKIAHSYYKT